jgi:hypothetical protein
MSCQCGRLPGFGDEVINELIGEGVRRLATVSRLLPCTTIRWLRFSLVLSSQINGIQLILNIAYELASP